MELDFFYGLKEAHHIDKFADYFMQIGKAVDLLNPDPMVADHVVFDMASYHGSFASSLTAFENTTNAKILMVFGATDPWISLRIPETNNPNVAVFVHPTAPHSANISSMPEEMRNEAAGILKGWLQ